MKLRQKSKRDQALDAFASIAKTWSEWRLGEKVSTTASKASKKTSKSAAKASKKAKKQAAKAAVPVAAKRTPVKIVGIVALVGGVGAAVAKKLSGGKAEPLYTPPDPAPDMPPPPPSPVAVEDLAKDSPAGEQSTPVPPTEEPALTAPKEPPPRDPSPVVVEDLVSDGGTGGAADNGAPRTDDTPDSGDLVSDTADEPAPGVDEPTDKPA
jgi:hypothetical protein